MSVYIAAARTPPRSEPANSHDFLPKAIPRSALAAWAIWREQRLSARERGGIALGLWIVEMVGLDNLFRGYDADRSGALSRAEFLADVRLDLRPLAEVLSDPAAVDRVALGARVEALAPLVEDLLADGKTE